MDLKFKGPYTKSELTDVNCLAEKAYGIYIWGFSFYKENENLKLFEGKITSNNLKLLKVPYYVGITGKKIGIKETIMGRHLEKISGPKTKYLNLTKNYLCKYFRDPDFPERCNPRLKWIKAQYDKNENFFDPENGFVSYINEQFFFEKIGMLGVKKKYKNGNLKQEYKDYPISLLDDDNEIIKRNTYSFLKQNPDSFFFMYADLDNDEFEKIVEDTNETYVLEAFEAFTKFSLQGKTIGDSKTFKEMKKRLKKIVASPQIILTDKKGNDKTKDYFLPQPRSENDLPYKTIYGL